MPNWVYSGIDVNQPLSKKQLKIVDKIEKAGSICQYYKPRPKEYDFISGSATINGKQCKYWKREKIDGVMTDVPVDEKVIKTLEDKYGFSDWYYWSLHNWNTKWGDCSLQVDIRDERTKTLEKIENRSEVPFLSVSFNFESAWSPICETILDMFAKDFPDFNLWYEEECEWGGTKEYIGGELINESCYDEPNWEEEIEINHNGISCNASYLREDHPSYEYGKGYYEDYSKDSYLGKTLEEAKDTLEIWESK
tara:strand:+ start:1069 stop:1821 length:753 start_codon:yes stop_codon:yes gene_type:complete